MTEVWFVIANVVGVTMMREMGLLMSVVSLHHHKVCIESIRWTVYAPTLSVLTQCVLMVFFAHANCPNALMAQVWLVVANVVGFE